MLKLRNVIEGNAFPLEIGQQFVGLRLQHDALADEVVNSLSVVVLLPRYQHVGRMLENNGQCYYWLTGISLQQQGARAYAEFCLALKDGFDRIAPRESFVNAYIKPRFAVVTQFFRCVVTGELEGMCPLQLQRNGIECIGRAHRQRQAPEQTGECCQPPGKLFHAGSILICGRAYVGSELP